MTAADLAFGISLALVAAIAAALAVLATPAVRQGRARRRAR
ncbi:hypothetical protein [Methylobacterium sp. D54C]